jgi:hypothetical protein
MRNERNHAFFASKRNEIFVFYFILASEAKTRVHPSVEGGRGGEGGRAWSLSRAGEE